MKRDNIHVIGDMERENRAEVLLDKIMDKNFLKLIKYVITQIKEAH